MGNHLRIEIAELTDIGRRRATNQDNLGRRVPDDPEEIGRKGALFVVADGMGGHAAGEIASTVAVQTITSTYPDIITSDVPHALTQSIKRANETILSIARANTDHMGMGTTVVAAVLCDGVAYIANIGDSRGYLIRDGKMRQVTVDHSWVGEQVRAGILTEAQARTHVHRNVITRSLGTQPDVSADIFVEPLRAHDIVLLCSDGLHGYVEDPVIAEVAQSLEPAQAVRKLVDLANEAGGPDNITVTIVRVEETPAAEPEFLQRLITLHGHRAANFDPVSILTTKRPPVLAPTPPAPLEPAKVSEPTPRRRSRAARVALLTTLVAAILTIFSAVAWNYAIGPYIQRHYADARVQKDIAKTTADLAALSALSPAQRLARLAVDQRTLSSDLLLDISGTELAQLAALLNNQIAPATILALQAYNSDAKIQPFVQATTTKMSLTQCADPFVGPLLTLTPPPPAPGAKAPTGPTTPQFYALTTTNQLQQLTMGNAMATCAAQPVASNVLAAASDGAQIDLLIQAPASVATPTTTPTAGATPPAATTTPTAGGAATTLPHVVALHADGTQSPLFTLSQIPTATTPTALVASNGQIAVLLKSSAGDTVDIVAGPPYDVTKTKQFTNPPGSVRGLAFGANGTLYLLLSTGAIVAQREDGTAIAQPDSHTVGDLTIPPVLLGGDPTNYTNATPVPTVPGTGDIQPTTSDVTLAGPVFAPARESALVAPTATPTATPTPSPTATPTPTPLSGPSTPLSTATALASDASAIPTIAVLDGKGQRVILLKGNGGVDLTLAMQFADPMFFGTVASVSLAPDGKTLYLLTTTLLVAVALP